MIEYFIQVNVAMALIYLIYRLLLGNLTFFRINRFCLLFIPVLSALLPFVSFPEAGELTLKYVLPAVTTGSGSIDLNRALPLFSVWSHVIVPVYTAGLLLSLSLFGLRLYSLLNMMRHLEFVKNGVFLVAYMEGNVATFSFFNYIAINTRDRADTVAVIEHEGLHYRSRHTTDNLFYEILKCLFWFNPAVYAMHRDIRSLHEFDVDARLKGEKNLNSTGEDQIFRAFCREYNFTNTYKSKSNLLNRLTMLHKKQSRKVQLLRYGFILPVIFFMVFIFSCTDNKSTFEPQETPIAELQEESIFPSEKLNELSVQPSFPGGFEALSSFLGSEIIYPETAKKEGLTGMVYVSFVVTTEGEITTVEVKKGIHPLLDAEAVRAISSMPDWTPGEFEGKKVNVQYLIPVSFVL